MGLNFFLSQLSAAWWVRQYFTMIHWHNRAQDSKVATKSVCPSCWLCSQTSQKSRATELNYRLWNDHTVWIQQKIYPRHVQELLVWEKLDDSDMKRQSLFKEMVEWVFCSTNLLNKWIWMWPQSCHMKFYSMGIKVSGFVKVFITGCENFSRTLLPNRCIEK